MLKNKVLIRVMAVVALIAFLATCIYVSVPPLFAGADKVSDAQKDQNAAKQKIDSAQNWRQAEITKREELDKQISTVQAEIDKYQTQIDEKTKQITETQQRIDDLSKDLVKQNEDYMERAKLLIQKGNISYVEILLNSKSIDDMMSRISMVKWIASYDAKRLDEIKNSMVEVEELKSELLVQKEAVIGLKTAQDTVKAELDGYRDESQKIIDQLQVDIEAFQAEYEEAKKREQQAREEAEKLRKEAEAAAAAKAAGKTTNTTSTVVAPTKFVGGQFLWPSNASQRVSSPYGYRIHPIKKVRRFHAGIDISAAYGTDILAANSGTVIVAGYNTGGYGNYVVISHGGGYSTLYAHASSLCVSRGQHVERGQVIAKCGSTGMSTGPHIHYEVQLNGKTVDPMQFYR